MDVFSVLSTRQSKVQANSWIIVGKNNECVIIDTNYEVKNLLNIEKLTPVAVFLTHEHYDHCEGVNDLRSLYNIKLITSRIANEAIGDAKKNLSVFEDGKGFVVAPADQAVEEFSVYEFMGLYFKCWVAKGHSAGGMIIQCEDMIFTGDTILNGIKTPTLLPTGSKKELEKALTYFEQVAPKGSTVYPGHGVPFACSEWSIATSLGRK